MFLLVLPNAKVTAGHCLSWEMKGGCSAGFCAWPTSTGCLFVWYTFAQVPDPLIGLPGHLPFRLRETQVARLPVCPVVVGILEAVIVHLFVHRLGSPFSFLNGIGSRAEFVAAVKILEEQSKGSRREVNWFVWRSIQEQ